MQRIAVFIGTRPEAIKMAPVVRALEASDHFAPIVVSTGQHREMLRQVTDLFGIDVDIDLDVMQPNQTLASLSARVIDRVDGVLDEFTPDFVLVQGDTTTVFTAALASFYRNIPVGHVEAGLRTGNIRSPFPEEANRRLVTPLASLHFAPTERSRANLLREHVPGDSIVVTGNTVIDALKLEIERQDTPQARSELHSTLSRELGHDWAEVPYVLVTGHRRENFGRGFEQICEALVTLAETFSDVRFVYPVHLNPNVKGPVHEKLGGIRNIRLIPPQDYSGFLALMNNSQLLLTDSGGVQEEAPSLGKPVLVMRDTTERPEGVDAGAVKLVGTDAAAIIEETTRLLSNDVVYRRMSAAVNPYGDGKAASRIVASISNFLSPNLIPFAEPVTHTH